MARRRANSKSGSGRSNPSNGRRSSSRSRSKRDFEDYSIVDPSDIPEGADVLIDVPVVKVDEIDLEVEDLRAQVAVIAQVRDILQLSVGADARLGKVELNIQGVEAQALLKVRLDHVAAIVDRVLTTLDRNPELVKSLGKAVEEVGSGAGHTLGETGDAVEEVGEGAEGAVQDIGEGAGQAVGQVGEGAGQAVGEIGQGAGQAVGDVGQGVGETVGNLDQAVGGLGQTLGQVGQGVGQAAGGVGQAAGQLGQGVGGQDPGGGGQGGGGGLGGASASQLAKEAAKTVAKEIGSTASGEAKELTLAAARKAHELSERRRQHRAEKHGATEAALRTARELGVDIEAVEGTGAEGRITVRDVQRAQAD